jgi:hypothetical protein
MGGCQGANHLTEFGIIKFGLKWSNQTTDWLQEDQISQSFLEFIKWVFASELDTTQYFGLKRSQQIW